MIAFALEIIEQCSVQCILYCASAAIPLAEPRAEPAIYFFDVVGQVNTIFHLFEKLFNDRLIPLVRYAVCLTCVFVSALEYV